MNSVSVSPGDLISTAYVLFAVYYTMKLFVHVYLEQASSEVCLKNKLVTFMYQWWEEEEIYSCSLPHLSDVLQ